MVEDKVFINFTCQRCSLPLRLDESLNSFSEHISAELNLPVCSNPDVDLESQATSFDHYVPPYRLSDSGNVAQGFMVISDDKEIDMLSTSIKIQETLFDKLSGNSHIDHPLCDECTDYLIELLEQEYKLTECDCEDYNKYYQQLKEETYEPKLCELEKELNDLKNEENEAFKELMELQKEEKDVLKEIEEQEEISKNLAVEEEKYFKEYRKHQRDVVWTEQEGRSLDCQLQCTNNQLVKLKSTNVYNATFHIWHKGHFGTINNFCLGRLPSAPVDWTEINVAWGQTVLLLSSLARKINLTFEKYRLVPYGNHSYIEVLNEQKELPLYGSGSFKFLWDTKFDNGMVAFLECLQQFQEKVEQLEKHNKSFCFPYKTVKGKIEDKEASYSIKIQLNSEEQWTKALKFMLTNLKWGLAWVASQLNNENEETVQTEDM